MKVRKAIIPSAGFGTRFLPATKSQPKEMLPVIDKPIIQYGVEEAAGAGIRHIGIITSRGKASIEDHFDSSPELESFLKDKGKLDFLEEIQRIPDLARFYFIRQGQALGLGHAVLQAEEFIAGEPFAVLLPDDIFDCPRPCIRQLMDSYEQHPGTTVVVGHVDRDGTSKYGIIKPKPVGERIYEVADLHEKPGPEKAFSDLGILGRYIFPPEIFDAIRETPPDSRGEIQITDAIKRLIGKKPVYGYLFEGRRFDAGNKLGALEAAIELGLKRPDIRDSLRRFLDTL